jgi:hypothetical protein
MSSPIPFQASNVSIGTSLTLLVELPLAGLAPQISFQVVNAATSAAATDNFVILRKIHDAGDWLSYIGGTDFQIATSKCNASTPGPHQLPPGESAWVDVDCGAAVGVQLWASASGGAVVSVLGGARTSW